MSDYVELTGSKVGSHSVDPLTSSMTIGQLWQKSIDSPFIGLSPDYDYLGTSVIADKIFRHQKIDTSSNTDVAGGQEFITAEEYADLPNGTVAGFPNYQALFSANPIEMDSQVLSPTPETIANSITYPKAQFGFWWEESLRSRIVTTFFTGVSTFLPNWEMNNNQAGDYLPGTPVTVSFPELPETVYDGEDFPVGTPIENIITQDYICHINPAFNSDGTGAKTTGDIPGYKIDPRWQLCGTNYANYNHGSWYETLVPDGNGNFTNSTDDGGQKRFTPGKKFRIKLGQFDLWGSSAEDWTLDEAYAIVKVKDSDSSGSPITFLDPENIAEDRKMPFMFEEKFQGNSAYGIFNAGFLGSNDSMTSGQVKPFHHMPADVTCWESINKYVTQSAPFFFTSMSVPFSSLISAHYKTNFDIFAYNFSEETSKLPHYADRYLKEENISTSYEYQTSSWVNIGYVRDSTKNTYSVIDKPLMAADIVNKHSNEGTKDSDAELGMIPGSMDSAAYFNYAYYITEENGVAAPDFNEPKFNQNEGYYGDLNLDPVYISGGKTKFETRLVDYVKSPFYWNRVFSSASNSIRTLSGKMSTALIFTEDEYSQIYGIASPINSTTQAKICWPAYNEYGFNTFDNTVLSHSQPESRTGNTLIGEFLVRSKIVSGFNWKTAADKEVFTWIDKSASTVKNVPAYDLIDFHRINNNEISSSITPQVSLSSTGATTSPPGSLTPTAPYTPGNLQDMLEEPVDVWHKGVKIPIYVRILDYPYSTTLNGNAYQGLGPTESTGGSFKIFMSALLGYTASYNQADGQAGNSKPIDHYSSWHTPGPNTIQQHAGQIDTIHTDVGATDSTSAPFGIHQGIDDGAHFYDNQGYQANLITVATDEDPSVDYNDKYKEVLDANEGALWRYPEAISSPYDFFGKNNHLHKIGYVQFPKTPIVGEGYVKEIAMLAVKGGTDDLVNINASIETDYVSNHLSADTGNLMQMTGGMSRVIEDLKGVMGSEGGETQIHNTQAQYKKYSILGGFKWWNESVPSDFIKTGEPGDIFTSGMYMYQLPAAKYNAIALNITQEEYYALSPMPDASDIDNDGNWLAIQANRTMYEFDDGTGSVSRYNPNSFSAANHIGDDDIAIAYDHAISIADGISTKLGEFLTNTGMDSMKIKVIDQPYFFAQQKNSANLFGNYKHTSDLDGVDGTVGRFYFYTGHSEFVLYPPMTVGIPALLESEANIPGNPTVYSATDTYTPARANYLNPSTATGKSFLRSFNLVKSANSGMNEHIGINAIDSQTRSLTIKDTVDDGAGVKIISGQCIVSNPPSISSTIPNRKNYSTNSYMVFYNSDTYDNNITFSFPMNAPNTGHQNAQLTVSGATGLSAATTLPSLTVGFQTSDLTGGSIDITLDDKLGLTIPDEVSGSEYTKNNNERSFLSMGAIKLDRSSLAIDLFENYKNEILWCYKDRQYIYSGATATNPAVLDSIFGSTWLPSAQCDFFHDGTLVNTYSTGASGLYDSTGMAFVYVNHEDYLLDYGPNSNNWAISLEIVQTDGTLLPTPFSKSSQTVQSRGIKAPSISSNTVVTTIPDNYNLFIGAVTNYIQEPTIDINFDLTVYSDLLAGGSADSHFYNHGYFKLIFTDDSGFDYYKNISKNQYKNPRNASATGTTKTHSLSYSLSQISPNSLPPISMNVLASDEILELRSSTWAENRYANETTWDWGTNINDNEPLIEAIYQRLLGRASDSGGLASWKSYHMSALRAVDLFIKSDEYQANVAAGTALADPRGDNSGDKFHASWESAITGLELDGNYLPTRFSSDIVDTWEFRDIDGNYRSFNHASNWTNTTYTSYISEKSLLLGTGRTVFKYGDEHFESASEGLIGRQRVFYASLCVMAIMNTSTNKALRINPETPARFTSLQSLGVDYETLSPFSLAGIAGNQNVSKHDEVNGMEEYNFWSLNGVFDPGKYTSKRAGHSICLSSSTPHDVFESTWGEYGPTGTSANLLPECVFQHSSGSYKKNTGGVHSDSTGGHSEPFSSTPSPTNGLITGQSIMWFPSMAKSKYDHKMPAFVTTTKINGWQTSDFHTFMFHNAHDPSGKTWEENFSDYKTTITNQGSFGPSVMCVRGNAKDYPSTPHDTVFGTSTSQDWVPWGDGEHLDPRELWDGGLSFTGRKPDGYLGFQNSSMASRITKRVNGVCPGVTYRLYFSAAYRPLYWGSGFRTYILEPHVGVSAPEAGDTEHKISRQLIAYGEYTHDANRWINYNAKRNVHSNLGRPWEEGDGYGFTCNMRRSNPYELDAALTRDGDGGSDDVLQDDKFKVFYIEFTPKKGSHVVEIIFETAYRIKAFGAAGSLTPYTKPDNWVDIPEDTFFDADYLGSNDFAPHVRNWDHQFRGPWVYNPNALNEAGGDPGNYSDSSRDNTWFLDEVWMTTARPCWVEPVKFKYNVPQGGYVLSIDQGDKSNRPVDDVFLSNSPSEVIKLSGQFPDTDSGGGIIGTIDGNNGYFKDGVEYEIDLVRQHTHIQNWDPFAVDGDNLGARFKRTNESLLMPWMPGDYFGGLVFSPPNPGLYYLKSEATLNSSFILSTPNQEGVPRLGKNNSFQGAAENIAPSYRAGMPTTDAGYNSLWQYIGDDPEWTDFAISSLPGWVGVMNTETGNNTTPGSLLMRHPYLPSITPSSLTVPSGAGNLEIDPKAGELHLYTSYPHTLMADNLGVYVELPIIGLVAFFNKDHLSNYTGAEASVDLTTAELFEGTFHLNELFSETGQYAGIRGSAWDWTANPTGTYVDWLNDLPETRQHIFKDGKLWLSIESNAHPSGLLGKKISEELQGAGWSPLFGTPKPVNIFTSTALWPWFMEEGSNKWGMFELNRHGEIGNTPKILWLDQGFPAMHWKKWMVGAGQNMSPVTRGSAYDKHLKLGYDFLNHHDDDVADGYRTNCNWVGDYIVVNHGALLNLWLARPIADVNNTQNPAGSRETARPAPSDDERDDTSSYFSYNGIAFTKESTHNNHKFRFL